MKLKKCCCGVAGTCRDFACARLPGDAEQQADHQITPEQPAELFGEFGGVATEKSRRLSPDGWIGYLADEPRPEGSQYVREALAIVRYGQVSGYLKPCSARIDACDQYLLLVAHHRLQFSFRNARAGGDLKRAGRRVAALHERSERCFEDSPAHARFVAAFLTFL
jgi:hypothetical protein